MKAVMLSIRPEWCEKIASGRKTVELRKSRPKLETPFKCYIYCTLPPNSELFTHGCIREYANELIRLQNGKIVYGYGMQLCCDPEHRPYTKDNFLCKKVIGEFVCDGFLSHCEMANADIAEQTALVRREEIHKYSNGKEVFGWHISELKIYDKPKELTEFLVEDNRTFDCPQLVAMKRAPQSWCYVEGVRDNG